MTLDQQKIENSTVVFSKECAKFIEEKKGDATILLDLREVNSYLDFFLITTGNSHLHCRSLARAIMKHFSLKKIFALNNADLTSGWIILDYGEVLIHIFTREMREFYQLEKLWDDAKKIEY